MTNPQDHPNPNKPHALAGIMVNDFRLVLAGATSTRMLSDAGARVIKIERPKVGDGTRQTGPFLDDGSAEFFILQAQECSRPTCFGLT
jgi:CoA:oxalate CoA-transferase